MPKQKPSDQIASLRKKQAELLAQLKEAETKARLEAKEIQRRKNELAGAVAIKELDANPSGSFAVALRDLLHGGLTKAADRALFDLPALPKTPANDAVAVTDGEPQAASAPPSKAKKAPRKIHGAGGGQV